MVLRGQMAESRGVTPRAPSATPRAAWLPRGRELAPTDFAWRHRFVCLLLGLHLPVLAALSLVRGNPPVHVLTDVVMIGGFLLIALLPAPRRTRSCAATAGLLVSSAVLVHVYDGATEMHFHYFVAVAVVALYEDWSPYALAVGFVLLQHGLVADGDGAWSTAAVHAAFVVAESLVLVVFWHANEKAQAERDGLRAALVRGEGSVRAQLEQTDRIRTDLIGTVSHEFRTPLTGIRGAALTLLKRGERLDASGRARLLQAVLDQEERLSRLLENMLTAAQATATDPRAAAEVDAVAAEVAMLAGATRPGSPAVALAVAPGTLARIDRQALHQVLANLVDNAQQHGAAGAVPVVAGGTDADGVWLTVSNEGTTLDADAARRLFEPFTQADTSPTRDREGLGMGLYVVRRLVEVHGGTVQLRSEDGWTTVELRLRPVTLDLEGLPLPRLAEVPGR